MAILIIWNICFVLYFFSFYFPYFYLKKWIKYRYLHGEKWNRHGNKQAVCLKIVGWHHRQELFAVDWGSEWHAACHEELSVEPTDITCYDSRHCS